MKTDIIQSLTKNFESYKQTTEQGVEFWYARDLQKLLDYSKWENFHKVIEKAKTSCKNARIPIIDHFPDIRKSIKSGKGAVSDISDYMLTRYACYLIAQNGDPSKEQIAFAQTYFAIQTRKYELIEERIKLNERLLAREKLSESEKQLSGVIFERTKDEKAFGVIRSMGDKALFGLSTKSMKIKWGVPKTEPLADYSPTVVLKGKDFANEMTIFNTKEKNLQTTNKLIEEHTDNNLIVRSAMLERGIIPEKLAPEEDIKKVKKKLNTNKKKSIK